MKIEHVALNVSDPVAIGSLVYPNPGADRGQRYGRTALCLLPS